MAIKKLLINGIPITYHAAGKPDALLVDIIDADGIIKPAKVTGSLFDQATGTLFFQCDGRPYRAHVSLVTDSNNQQVTHVSFVHTKESFAIASAAPLINNASKTFSFVAAHAAAKPSASSGNLLKSPLAGRVSKIFVSPAQLVKLGQPLVLIESMKMENEICASRAGFIKTILITQGNVVQPEQVLIEFENEGEGDGVAKSSHESQAIQDR